MIDAQETPVRIVRAPGKRQIADKIIVVAELPILRGGTLTRGVEGGRARRHRVSPTQQHPGVMIRRDMVALVDAMGEAGESEAGLGGVAGPDRHRPGAREAAGEKAAPGQARRNQLAESGGIILLSETWLHRAAC